jgi:hypothetical protein
MSRCETATSSPQESPQQRVFRPHSKFTSGDDALLRSLIETHGTSDWHLISSHMEGKNQRQCKERWINYLCPDLNTSAWTPDEDALLLQKYIELGTKWVKIAMFFPHRTDAMVKNRFNKIQRREQKRRELFAKRDQMMSAALHPTVFCPGPIDLDDLEPSFEPLPMIDCPTIELESHGGEDSSFKTEFWSEFSFGFDRGIGEFSGF